MIRTSAVLKIVILACTVATGVILLRPLPASSTQEEVVPPFGDIKTEKPAPAIMKSMKSAPVTVARLFPFPGCGSVSSPTVRLRLRCGFGRDCPIPIWGLRFTIASVA